MRRFLCQSLQQILPTSESRVYKAGQGSDLGTATILRHKSSQKQSSISRQLSRNKQQSLLSERLQHVEIYQTRNDHMRSLRDETDSETRPLQVLFLQEVPLR